MSLIVLGGALALLPGTALDLVFAVSDSEVAADAYLISAGHLLSILGVVYLAVRAALRHQLDVIGLTTVIALMTIVRLTALGS